ncbi:UbiA family prenyltransferase [Haloferula sp. BvORR071]|uniref:UbiA family prenyltransferase n=1 Tax=Haloferula sp. BvORR071 TaxID=1396141 RepID=UPI000552CD87|nr:UbiA family prenyltransferase [Haloferula sp. BvORR071]
MSRPGKVRALLATLRIANAPSVVSNVFLGFMVGWIQVAEFWNPANMDWGKAGLAALSGLMLYFAGNLANDWFDRRWDAEKRPERALPSGLFKPGSYLTFSLILAIGGVSLGFYLHLLCGCTAVLICLLIAIYTYFHKRAVWAVIPMGLCRVGLYFLGYFVWWLSLDYLQTIGYASQSLALDKLKIPAMLGVGLFSYIVGLSLSARYEGMEDPPRAPQTISRIMLLVPFVAMSAAFLSEDLIPSLIGMIPFGIWLTLCLTRFKKPIPRYVSALLAGIPLVDLIAATPIVMGLNATMPTLGLRDLPHLVAMLVIPVVAFILGRLLQRLAPAT